ncbi:TPA: DUF6442 family protein [Clostridium perfringens]
MKKEDILKKSRESIEDEGMSNAQNEGLIIGAIITEIFNCIIAIFGVISGQVAITYAASALFWPIIAGQGYSKYCFTKKKSYLFITIFGSLISISYLISFIVTMLKL